ncbi:unnamed protein product, partial [Brenthis ino]
MKIVVISHYTAEAKVPAEAAEQHPGGKPQADRKVTGIQEKSATKTRQAGGHPRTRQDVRPSTTEESLRKEPLYDIGPHSSLIPEQDLFCQNFEFSGFIPLVHETYEKLRGVDPRLQDRLQASMFMHAMSTYLNLELIETARKTGQHVLNIRTDVREILADYQVIPQPIADYISHVTSVITPDGREVKFNLPEIAISQGPGSESGKESRLHQVELSDS